jgi:RHS repeat-associated protein
MRKANTIITAVFILLGSFVSVFGQSSENNKNSKDKTARSSGTVNPTSLGLELSIPLGNTPGRAGNSLPITFNYSSKVWRVESLNVPEDGHSVYWANPFYSEEFNTFSGWTTSLQVPYFENSTITEFPAGATQPYQNGQIYTIIPKKTLHLPDGSTVELVASLNPISVRLGSVPPFTTFFSIDGSNLKLVNGTLFMPDGSTYVWSVDSNNNTVVVYSDRNGNKMSYQKNSTSNQYEWIDSMGRNISIPKPPLNSTNQLTEGDVDYYSPTMPNTQMKYTFKWRKLASSFGNLGGTYSINTLGGLFPGPVVQGIEGTIHNPVVLNEIVQPDGKSYKFYYNEHGEIEKVIYPTGTQEKFVHANVMPFSFGVGLGAFLTRQGNRGVINRTVSIDTNTANDLHWQYSVIFPSLNSPYTVQTINPDLSKTERLLYKGITNSNGGLPSIMPGKTYEERLYSTDGTLVNRSLTKWSGTTNSAGQIYAYAKVDRQTGIKIDGTNALAQSSTSGYDTYLNVTRQKVFDFVPIDLSTAQSAAIDSIAIGTPLKTVETTYVTDTNYTSKQMVSMPLATFVKTGDENGAIVAKTENSYDDAGYGLVLSGALSGIASNTWADPSTIYRANHTTTRVWNNITNTWIETHARFDQYGNMRKSIDAKGIAGETEYSTTYACAYPTKSITPIADPTNTNGSNVAFETTSTFDYTTGLPLSSTDANGQISTIEYNDVFLRPTRVTPPTGAGISETIYNDTPGNIWVKNRTQIDGTNWAEAITYIDGLGRAFKSEKVDADGNIFSETEFDFAGRPLRTTNPYRANEAKQWTTNVYDEQSRIKQVTLPGGATVKTDFGVATSGILGITKQITDQAGKKRKGISDALGRMVRVIEDPTGQNLATDYVFDTLGNLRKTIQGEQSRYFTYDSLGRLLYAKQPEQEANTAFAFTDPITNNSAWSVKYQYDDNGNIVSTTDARGVSVAGTYDNFNRLKLRDYSDATPDVSFFYDGKGLGATVPNYAKGKTTKVTSSVSETRYRSFDNLGKLLTSEQRTPFVDTETIATATPRVSSYQYNAFGALISETYPSGRKVNYEFNQDGEIARIGGTKGTQNTLYANALSYNSAGAMERLRLGNGKWETAKYNERLQVTQIGLGSSATDTSLLKINYDYGNNLQNNGSLREQKINYVGLANEIKQSYGYDNLNRLQSSVETVNNAVTWQQTFSYDRFGNRRFDAANTNTLSNTVAAKVANPQINTSDNRLKKDQDNDTIADYDYDKTGNMTLDAENKRFIYDAENHVKSFFKGTNNSATPDATYFYDGEGKRVKKISSTETTIFVYDGGSQLVAEYSTVSSNQPKVSYLTADHLGSPRIITDAMGKVISRHDYLAFGDEVTNTLGNVGGRNSTNGYGVEDDIRKQYTGYEKDEESDLDFAQARYYNGKHGRFTSVDPLTASANVKDPQTFNRYSYGLNSPYKFTDPLGLVSMDAGSGSSRGSDVNHSFMTNSKSVGSLDFANGKVKTIKFTKIAEVEINGKKVPIYSPVGTTKATQKLIIANVQGAADRINAVASGSTTQLEMMLSADDKKYIGSLKQLVYVPPSTGSFIASGVPNITTTNDDGTAKMYNNGQQDVRSATWISSDLTETTPEELVSTLGHEGMHQIEYLKDPKKFFEATPKEFAEREIRTYKYQLDFYTRFAGKSALKPDDWMNRLSDLIKTPYTGPN